MTFGFNMDTFLNWAALFLAGINSAVASLPPATGVVSWYGEEHRGVVAVTVQPIN